MLSLHKNFAPTALLLSTLSACGGGSTSAVPFTSISELPDDGEVTATGDAVTTNFERRTDSGYILTSGDTSRSNSTLSAKFRDKDVVAASGSADNSSFKADTDAGDEVINETYRSIFVSPSDQSLAVLSNSDATNLDHTVYGAWMDFDGATSGRSTAAVYGTKTSANDMPTSGSARYTGKSIGLARISGRHYYATESDIELSTSDFENISISSSNTRGTNLSGARGTRTSSAFDFSGTGTIEGTSFSANVTAEDSSYATGTVDGNFYGNDAAEVGGTFELPVQGGNYIGSFGAKR